jgi:ATP-dependent RNA helicase RhlE
MLFKDLSLIEPLLRALETEGYAQPTPIQEQAIPIVLNRRDLLGCAQTGTGKTAAFSLPILQILHDTPPPRQHQNKPIRCLILTPTRELAIQIGESIQAYGRNTKLRQQVIFGGVSQHAQTEQLKRGTDILVATPGRLLDLMNQGFISLRDIEIFVLDEADRMLDMGFIHDVKKVIAKLPTQRQTLFFSATMPPEISDLAHSILTNPERVEVTPVSSTAEKVEQAVYFVQKADKRHLLVHLLKSPEIKSVLVFTRTKHGANKVAADLTKSGVKAEAIHGNKSQNARQAALSNFKAGRIRVLVATDIAARGIDIEELSHVINFELPNIPETYVHRIGRTGRAGASGIALSFCEAEEIPYLKDIQKLTGQLVPVVEDHPYVADLVAPGLPEPRGKKAQKGAKPTPPPPPARPMPEGVAPLPAHRPDRQQQQQQQRRPAQPQQGQQHRQPQQGNQRDGQQQQGQPKQRDGQQQGQQNRQQPESHNAQQQPRRHEQRPQQQKGGQKPAPPQSSTKGRFSSILEVSAIEKQDFRPNKPKPNYRDRPAQTDAAAPRKDRQRDWNSRAKKSSKQP